MRRQCFALLTLFVFLFLFLYLPQTIHAAAGSIRPVLTWQRSLEVKEAVLSSDAISTVIVKRALQLPLDANQTVFDNGTHTAEVNKQAVGQNIEWASWPHYSLTGCGNPFSLRRFRASFILPDDFNPSRITTLKLKSPYYEGDVFMVNDEAYLYLNENYIGTRAIGLNLTNIGQNGTAKYGNEVGGWVGEGDFGNSPVKHLKSGANVLDIVAVEKCGWGGMGKFDVVLETDTLTPDKPPLILIPGIMGSEFEVKETFDPNIVDCLNPLSKYSYTNSDTVWLNKSPLTVAAYKSCGRYLDVLKLQNNGMSPVYPQIDIKGTITDPPYNDHTVPFLTEKEQGYVLNKDLFLFPYDWRKDITTQMPALNETIDEATRSAGSSTVQILAHSMGGLVAREYIRDAERAKKVDMLVELGTPHAGTPTFLAHLLYNKCIDSNIFGLGCVVHGAKVNELVQNFPGAFELLPSKRYFQLYSNQTDYPFNDIRDIDKNDIKGSLTYDQLKTLFTNLNKNMPIFNLSETFHDALDPSYSTTNGVKTYIIAGSGFPTIGQIRDYRTKAMPHGGGGILHQDALAIDGDGTVPVKSVTLGLQDAVYYVHQEHGDLPKNEALTMAFHLLNGETDPIGGVQKTPFQSSFKGKIISIHSPADLHAYDDHGNHVGMTNDGDVEVNIPGASYDELGEATFIYLPDGGHYRVATNATGEGSFDLKVKTYAHSALTKELLYLTIDQTMQTTTALTLDTDAPMLSVDTNGDGSVDQELAPTSVLSGEALSDHLPPTTSVQTTGTEGSDKWYRSPVILTLTAQDAGSGVLQTEYSLDGGKTVQAYVSPLSVEQEGTTIVRYHSIDRAGNEEEPKEITVKIDTIPPELIVQFNPKTKQLVSAGEDRGSGVASTIQTDKAITVEDKAGNGIQFDVALKKADFKNKTGMQMMIITGLKYNQQPVSAPKVTLSVEWNADKDNAIHRLIQTYEVKGQERLSARYNENKDKTTIIEKEKGSDKERSVVQGLSIITLKSEKGKLNIEF